MTHNFKFNFQLYQRQSSTVTDDTRKSSYIKLEPNIPCHQILCRAAPISPLETAPSANDRSLYFDLADLRLHSLTRHACPYHVHLA